MPEYFDEKKVKIPVKVAPCIKCGSKEILLSDCGYSSFNKGGGKCQKCGNTVSTNVGIDPSYKELAGYWNIQNDIDILITGKISLITSTQSELSRLYQLKKDRNL